MTPAVSIIIPTLNRIQLLRETLDSVRAQTFTAWEAMVVDDGSEDGTAQMLQDLSQLDPRIKHIQRRRQNSGASACRNEGTDFSQGEYIIYLDSDDCLAPKALENRWREMEQHRELDFGVFPCIIFRDRPGDAPYLWNADTGGDDIDRFLAIMDPPWQTTSPIWRRSAVAKIGGWDENTPSLQDWEFHIRAIIAGLNYQRFSPPDCYWRMPRQESISFQSKTAAHLESREKLFANIHRCLLEGGLLTDRRRHLLAGMYLWLAEAWIARDNPRDALAVWQIAHEKQLVPQPFYGSGIWYLQAIARKPPEKMAKFMRKTLEMTWPEGMVVVWSKTFKQIPVAPELMPS
ncbi:MAG TPA: glycosyltransferase family 2 protein [Oscillatoriaceae cyanobacterium M33_DOE_052]|uniref:Glycosyltransferase family 2 protein n=1 Tax=Planktothricoides sp. SpSt-374 TaxID=2282167 RepID=A0A7C3ZLW8_9CYAN|nr:glycosyltransferase family 2 protein [Oscillatoriaceae cyanobacterium M33_DOE_052]